eukprot:TRINITY_DN3726_c0_g1_i1.p1 TRINITY_DN3726_c0_g1~~TRINITY_DN3726_c0_g1_i1.p1  ORF type:complete len:166 (-),score=72.57 TRINITY_DN3726_c0_g1_i1:198-695(-)
MDPSHAHSAGWAMADDSKMKKLCEPNYQQTPPTIEECAKLRGALARIERFYTEGGDKQNEYTKMSQDEQKIFQAHSVRVEAQLKALQKYPADHSKRKQLEASLELEKRYNDREHRARVAAEERIEMLNQKRQEFVKTLSFMQRLMNAHCSSLESSLPSANHRGNQ